MSATRATVRIPQTDEPRVGIWLYEASNEEGHCLGAFLGYEPLAPEDRLRLMGRDRALADKVAGWVHRALSERADHGLVQETARGATFDVLVGGDGEPATHVFTVSITLDRIEQPALVEPTVPTDPPMPEGTGGLPTATDR